MEYPPSKSVSELVKRTSRRIEEAFPELKQRYWGKHFRAIGYRAWRTGNLTEQMVEDYLEHHRDPSNKDTGNMLLA
jgi:putative transposase